MTILYRSPNVTVDTHDRGPVEFHITVEQRRAINIRRSVTRTFFRSRNPDTMWQPLDMWIGPRPKDIRRHFRRYRVSIADAHATADPPVMRTPQRWAA